MSATKQAMSPTALGPIPNLVAAVPPAAVKPPRGVQHSRSVAQIEGPPRSKVPFVCMHKRNLAKCKKAIDEGPDFFKSQVVVAPHSSLF